MRFSRKHPSNVSCSAVIMLSPWIRDIKEMKKTTQAIKLATKESTVETGEMNKLTQIKPIQTKKPVCTLAFQFWLSSKLYIYIYIYIWDSNKKGRIESHPQQDNLPHMLKRCLENSIQYLLNRHVWQLSKYHMSAASMISKSNSIVSFWPSSSLRQCGNMAPDVLRPKD